MEVKVEQLDKLTYKAHFDLPLAPVEKEVEEKLKKIAKTTKIQGFRPGKVPFKIIEKQYGPEARQDAVFDSINKAFDELVKEKNYNIAGQPEFIPETNNIDPKAETFKADVVFDLYPEITIGDLNGCEIKKPVLEITDKEVDKTLDSLRKRHKIFEEVDRASKDGDKVVMDYEGKLDGVAFGGGKAENADIILGEGRFLPDFEKALYGVKAGDTKTFEVHFPDNYGHPDLAGKTAEFTAKVHKVLEPKLPPVDEAFAKRMGIEDGNLETLRADIKKNLEHEVQNRIDDSLRRQTLEKLLEAVDFDLPKSMVKLQQNSMLQNVYAELAKRGLEEKDAPLPEDKFLSDAEKKVKAALLFNHIIEKNKFVADPEAVRERIKRAAEAYQQPDEVVKMVYNNNEQLESFKNVVVEDQVMDWAMKNMTVVEEPMPFSEILPDAKEEKKKNK